MIKKLHVVPGPDHKHAAQKPVELKLGDHPAWDGLPAPKVARAPEPKTPTARKTTVKTTAAKPAAKPKATTAKRTTAKPKARSAKPKATTARTKATTAKKPATAKAPRTRRSKDEGDD
jgi:hypothetical protein